MQLVYFCNAKGQREIKITLAFLASHEARCRMAVYAMQLAGNHTKPASRGICHATAVKPRPSRLSPRVAPRLMARSGMQGYYPCPRAARPVAERR